MTYQETLDYLYNSTPVFERVGASAYKPGLYNTHRLDSYFGLPHRQYRTIHVAGTNGKGSVSHTLAAILQSAGYRVGLYTSPHLVDFAERIRVDGKPIAHDYVVDFTEKHKGFFEELHPSFFELVTAMAFKYFADSNIGIAVVEVGLGGRLDCTNIITPILSVITNISYDHTGLLGSTLREIAGEKAGIMKERVPVVIGEWNDETLPVFKEKADECKARLILAGESDCECEYQLVGYYQQKNRNTVMCAVQELQQQGVLPADNEAVKAGMSHVCDLTGLRGRWETVCMEPLVICDTGHNVAGWQYLAPQIMRTYHSLDGGKLRMVFGMVDDKDIDTVMKLLPKEAEFYFCQASTHRAIPSDRVLAVAEKNGIEGRCFQSVEDAYAQALADSTAKDFIFVGGSSYVVADFLTSFSSDRTDPSKC